MKRLSAYFAAVAAALLLSGCAGFGQNPRDPLEPFNREVSKFNEGLDAVVLKPVATAYRDTLPAPVRTGVANFFGNLGDAWSAVNSLLQLRFQDAEESLARFQINTFAGVFGIFDVASELNIERHKEDFGQTLGRWGVPSGPYVVLPILGPSTMRDALVLPVERYGDLTRQAPEVAYRNDLFVLRAIDTRANLLRVGNVIEGAALDKYSFTRDAYLQKRRADIFDDARDDRNDGQGVIRKVRPTEPPAGGDGKIPKEGEDDGKIPKEGEDDGKIPPVDPPTQTTPNPDPAPAPRR